MSEKLISADKLIQFVENWGKHHGREEAADSFLYAINNAPAVDAVAVVRCGKCRYASDDIGAIARRYGKRGAVKCCNPNSIANNRLCLSDDFCSYGKEKE